jgi:hypothetical protein
MSFKIIFLFFFLQGNIKFIIHTLFIQNSLLYQVIAKQYFKTSQVFVPLKMLILYFTIFKKYLRLWSFPYFSTLSQTFFLSSTDKSSDIF